MKTKLTWFIIGFLVAIGLTLILGYCSLRWGSRTSCVVGPVIVAAPRTNGIVASLRPTLPPKYPIVFLYDTDGNGVPNNLVAHDAAERYFEIIDVDEDGIWDKYTYSTGTSPTSDVSYWDMDMDGTLDFMIGPKQSSKLRPSAEWRDVPPKQSSTSAFFTNINSLWHFPKKDQKE